MTARHAFPARRLAHRGFTLIEIMMAIAIVAIVARLALPAYTDYIRRGKTAEAFNQLTASASAAAQFYQDNRSYAALCIAPNVDKYVPTTSGTTNFSYTCTVAATTYTITATAKSTSVLNGLTYTLDQSGNKATTAAGTTGWPTSASCWINNKSGNCY